MCINSALWNVKKCNHNVIQWWNVIKLVKMESYQKFRLIDAFFVLGSIITFVADQATGNFEIFCVRISDYTWTHTTKAVIYK